MTDYQKVTQFLKRKAIIHKEFFYNGKTYYVVGPAGKVNYGNPFVTIENGKPVFYSPRITDNKFFEVAFSEDDE